MTIQSTKQLIQPHLGEFRKVTLTCDEEPTQVVGMFCIKLHHEALTNTVTESYELITPQGNHFDLPHVADGIEIMVSRCKINPVAREYAKNYYRAICKLNTSILRTQKALAESNLCNQEVQVQFEGLAQLTSMHDAKSFRLAIESQVATFPSLVDAEVVLKFGSNGFAGVSIVRTKHIEKWAERSYITYANQSTPRIDKTSAAYHAELAEYNYLKFSPMVYNPLKIASNHSEIRVSGRSTLTYCTTLELVLDQQLPLTDETINCAVEGIRLATLNTR